MTNEQYEKAKELYKNNNYTITKVSEIVGVNRKTLSKKFKEDNINNKYRISYEKAIEIKNWLDKNNNNLTKAQQEFGYSRKGIKLKLVELGLLESSYNFDFNKDKVLELHSKGHSSVEISEIINDDDCKINRFLRTMSLKPNSSRKRTLNKENFKKIDNEAKAYWLGFLYADGYVNIEKGVELALKKADKEHIEKFNNFMETDAPINFRPSVNAYRTAIHSKELAKDLTKLGCGQNKSLTLKFPTEEQVPKELIHHFMRGYFDGDGCIYYYTYGKIKSIGTTVIGTKEFLDEYESIILEILNRTDNNKRLRCGNAYEIRYSGKIQTIKIMNFLYKDATIYLERKYDIFAALRQGCMESESD